MKRNLAWIVTGSLGAGLGQAPAQAAEDCCAVVELRQYLMKPGRRDDLIALFERHFLEGQEQQPMRIIGQFRNRRAPDRFVWLRGFADMEVRREALEGFYGGPVWGAHRSAANDTMIDSDNVLLLKPARADSAFRLKSTVRPGLDRPPAVDAGLVILTIHYFDAPADAGFVDFFGAEVAPVLRAAGAPVLAQFATESSPNTFTRLPVRNENVFVWVTSFANEAAYRAHRAALDANRAWKETLAPALRARSSGPEEVLELMPGARSLLRHGNAEERSHG